MRSYLVPIILAFPWTPACAFDGEAPQNGEVSRAVSDRALETTLLESLRMRGFILDGTGCTTVGDPIVEDNAITFLLAGYAAERRGVGLARQTCEPAVEIDLPAGVTTSLEEVVFKGLSFGETARSTFLREYLFPGGVSGGRRFTVVDYDAAGSPRLVQNDSDSYADESGDFTARDSLASGGASLCGGLALWRVSTAVSVRNTSAASIALLSFETVDAENQYFMTLRFGAPRPCP